MMVALEWMMRAKVFTLYSSSQLSFDHIPLGDDWDELERKAAKSDKKRELNGNGHNSDADSSERNKKPAAKPNGNKTSVKPAKKG